jgi:hypothetical protein
MEEIEEKKKVAKKALRKSVINIIQSLIWFIVWIGIFIGTIITGNKDIAFTFICICLMLFNIIMFVISCCDYTEAKMNYITISLNVDRFVCTDEKK